MKIIMLLEANGTKSFVGVTRLDRDAIASFIESEDLVTRDCGDNLTLWSRADKTGLKINDLASSMYYEATEFIESIYGDVVVTGKTTLAEISGVDVNDFVA